MPEVTYAQQRVTVDAFGWDPLEAPAGISRVVLKNIGQTAIKFRTTSDDGTTEDTIQISESFIIQPWRQAAYRQFDRVGFLQAVSGTGTLVVQWHT